VYRFDMMAPFVITRCALKEIMRASVWSIQKIERGNAFFRPSEDSIRMSDGLWRDAARNWLPSLESALGFWHLLYTPQQ
jgi:hypothetical protein